VHNVHFKPIAQVHINRNEAKHSSVWPVKWVTQWYPAQFVTSNTTAVSSNPDV